MKHCFHTDLKFQCSSEKLTEAYILAFDYKNQIMEELENLSEEEMNSYFSVGHYMTQKFDKKLEEFNHDVHFQNALKSVFMCTMNSEADSNGSETVFELDVKGFVSFVDLQGDLHYAFDDNVRYSDIPYSIFQEIRADSNDIRMSIIKFNCIVESMEYDEYDDVIQITCENGETFCADVVVLTIPIEVLKVFVLNNKIRPKLSDHKVKSINKFCLGQITKLFVKFVKPINQEIKYIRFYPSYKCYDEVRDSCNLSESEKYSKIFCLDRIHDSEWWLVWLDADLTNELQNNNSQVFVETLFDSLREIYELDLKVDLEEFYVSDWTTSRFYGGSYSYLPVGATELDVEILSEPIFYSDTTALFFSGEMSQAKFYSTTHGAYLSGIREAERIIKVFNLQK